MKTWHSRLQGAIYNASVCWSRFLFLCFWWK